MKVQCLMEDSGYKKIDGKCFYFEETSLTYDAAKSNCIEKLKPWPGKLFEPATLAENNKIATIFGSLFSGLWWPHIGVNDMSQEDTFLYNTTGLPINFSPVWTVNHGPGVHGTDSNCIALGYWSSFVGEWVERPCSTLRPSICESSVFLP